MVLFGVLAIMRPLIFSVPKNKRNHISYVREFLSIRPGRMPEGPRYSI